MKDKYFFHHLNSRFFEISGKDSKSFIQNLITNDIEKCNDGSIIYSCLLTPQGKFLACLLYTSPSPRDRTRYRMPSSA